MKRLLKGNVWLRGGTFVLAAVFALAGATRDASAQGVTSSSVAGIVKDTQGLAVPGATVTAVHGPSGTTYEAYTLADGRFSIQGMRVGGPYAITANLSGFQPQTVKEIFLSLGQASDVSITLGSVAMTEEVTVSGKADPIFSSERTGAGTAVNREAITTLPTISNRLESFVKLTPQAGANLSFGGVDNRLNNITVDGSYFNNSFGLAGAPGDRTGVAPISMAAVEAVQVNIAPYDVRQGNFVGAGVNTVTRSGTNSYSGSVYYQFRDESLVGKDAGDLKYNPGTFDYSNLGVWLGGPIIKNKLFFFGSFEDESLTAPGTTFTANPGGAPVAGNMTRVLASDLDQLSATLKSRFGYETGPYQGYDFETPAKRYLAKLDYNINQKNKLSLRYTQLDSFTDVLLSNSSSLGFGNRRTSTTGLNFQNSNYQILENIRSIVGEVNSTIGNNKANTLIAGYTYQDESRAVRGGTFFPMVDILEASSVYTTFGYEPFTPNNELRYKTFQLQDNFSWFRNKHTLTFGASVERYESENVFYPGSQSVYVYNSLADFYTDINDLSANPSRTTSPITLRRFQVRYMNIPNLEKPVQPLEVWYTGAYAQDVWQASDNIKVTYGLRIDVPKFGDTAFANPAADALTFRDETGAAVQYSTGKLPDPKILWSPRVGFNWDVLGDRSTQVRGGTGVFTGRPAYVWISNQIGNTGMLTGFSQLDNTNLRPFNPNPDAYKPTSVTGAPASSYELAVTDPDFKFPQVWRSSIAIDRRLPWGWAATAEFIYSRDVNGVYYIDANLPASQATFAGADARPRWTSNRIYSHVANNTVLKNQNEGRAWTMSGSLEKAFRTGFWVKAGYRYGEAKNTVDPGSIARGSWTGNAISGDPNNPGLGFAGASPGYRVFATASYRFEYFNFGATTVSVFWEGYTGGNTSYVFSGDLNGDGGTANDLIYIPRNTSEMNFQTYTTGGVTYTSEAQAAAWEAFINQDKYLSEHRGEYAVRNAVFLPMVYKTDLNISQDLFANLWGKRHTVQFRMDVLNLANLLNKDWGVGRRLVSNSPLISPSVDAQGRAQYRLRLVGGQMMTKSLEPTAGLGDVYRLQFSLRYTF